MTTASRTVALIPAYNEATRVADTVRAARALPGVTRVVVVDDGSTDDTARLAKAAGAKVMRQPKNAGKGAAIRAGLAALPGSPQDILLLLDADLGATASEAALLLAPVARNEADLAIAQLPATGKAAGFGLVKGLARAGVYLLGRVKLTAPLSGQRAARRWVLEAAPIADGYGVETAMNIAAAEAGARIVEVPTAMAHQVTGRTLAGMRHRARQGLHVVAALVAALCGRTGAPLVSTLNPLRLLAWVLAVLWLHVLYTARLARWLPPDPAAQGWLLLAVVAGVPVAALGAAWLRARRANYRAHLIPAIGGLLLAPLFLVAATRDAGRFTRLLTTGSGWLHALPLLLPLALIGWLALGLVDDLFGNADRRGFRGHLRALIHGKITTGGAKLLVGGGLALGIAWTLAAARPAASWWAVPLGALLIALSANALNLFDLRPGRALKVYWAVAIPLLMTLALTGLHEPAVPAQLVTRMLAHQAAFVLLATFLFAPFDLAGMMMLGDTGANALGAFLGLCLALMLPLWGQGLALLLLIGLHVYAERVSFTRVIERAPALRWLDSLGRSA